MDINIREYYDRVKIAVNLGCKLGTSLIGHFAHLIGGKWMEYIRRMEGGIIILGRLVTPSPNIVLKNKKYAIYNKTYFLSHCIISAEIKMKTY